ncbi:MAG: hypothetical protein WKG07_34525 [Hymenobacter sp.]
MLTQDRPGAPQSTLLLGLPVADLHQPRLYPAAGHKLAARRLIRVAHYPEYSGGQGLHVFALQLRGHQLPLRGVGLTRPT